MKFLPPLKAKIFLIAVSVVFFACQGPSGKIKQAQKLENAGEYEEALSNYISVAKTITARPSKPDNLKGKMLESEIWLGQIREYMDEFLYSPEQRSKLYPEVISGIQRCSESIEPINFPAKERTTPLAFEPFKELWTENFPSPTQGFNEWEKMLNEAFGKEISFFKIKSRKSYTYDISVWNLKTSRRIDVTLYAESSVMLPLAEGEYYVLCRSRVVFSGGQRWESPWSAFPITIPASSLTQMEIRTSVPRKLG